jgi:predicted DNA-binding protein
MRKLEGPEADYIKTSLRLPPEVREAVQAAAKANGRTMNQEIVARIMEGEDRATFKVLVKQNEELRKLMREMLDQIEMLK